MKKLIIVPAILALSANFAFAIDLSQALKLNQSIGDTSKGGFALNKAFVVQAQVPVNAGKSSDLSQKADISQSIGNTSKGGEAINKATVIQAQVPLSFGSH
ncbi:hypothetical protein WOC76_14300 [Methylocystis sp. IM3]|jgi:hypothetical protein|uniref:hypothetical protein n=1 Tax=unclassified Methylocystis TaxID=2625913 RepID=UPI0030FA2154